MLAEVLRAVVVVFVNGLITLLGLLWLLAAAAALVAAAGYLFWREYLEERPPEPLQRRVLY